MTKNEFIQAGPPLSVTGLTLWGLPLNEWVYVLTALYTLFLICDKLITLVRRFINKEDHE